MSESQRHELYESVKEAHGEAIAETFMNTHPPLDWDKFTEQFATKADLAELESRLLKTFGTWLFISQGVVVAVVAAFGVFG